MTGLVPHSPTQPAEAGSDVSMDATSDAARMGRPEAVKGLRLGKQTRAEWQSYSGPIPHPEHFAAYEMAVPGSGARILGMAEAQAKHRQQLETKHLTETLSIQKWGLVAATIIALTICVGGIWLISTGKSTEGLSALVGAVVSLVGLFIYGGRRQVQEQAKKRAAGGG